jgi:hypothetical protein
MRQGSARSSESVPLSRSETTAGLWSVFIRTRLLRSYFGLSGGENHPIKSSPLRLTSFVFEGLETSDGVIFSSPPSSARHGGIWSVGYGWPLQFREARREKDSDGLREGRGRGLGMCF